MTKLESDSVAKDARIALEQKTGQNVVTGENFLPATKIKKLLGDKK
ncbi:MAG: hypothetical protein NTW50_00410 [Candidatus Berkelbacteria bacterium]|nr:hypothetical protein [Candidatus Berkelbacteria bacterium]